VSGISATSAPIVLAQRPMASNVGSAVMSFLPGARKAEAQRLSHSGVSAFNETAVLYGSEETYRIWGFDPAQGVPTLEAVFQRIHPDDRDRLNAEVRRAVSEKRGYTTAYRIVLPDGTIKHLETIGRPEFSASGNLSRL